MRGVVQRLCTAAEWTAACRGPEHFVYPYGNVYVPGACNAERHSPVDAVFGPLGEGSTTRGSPR